MSTPNPRVLAISMITNVAQEAIDQSAEQQANHTEGMYKRDFEALNFLNIKKSLMKSN